MVNLIFGFFPLSQLKWSFCFQESYFNPAMKKKWRKSRERKNKSDEDISRSEPKVSVCPGREVRDLKEGGHPWLTAAVAEGALTKGGSGSHPHRKVFFLPDTASSKSRSGPQDQWHWLCHWQTHVPEASLEVFWQIWIMSPVKVWRPLPYILFYGWVNQNIL